MPSIEDVKHLQIPVHDVSSATNGFATNNLIAKGGFGNVYKGISEKHGHIAVKRLDRVHGQGDQQFKMEIALLSKYKHENIASLLGFCNEGGEKILVYKYESNGSLDSHLNNQDLTWLQRLHICIDAALGLKYLHDDAGLEKRIIHRDVKSANILLNENWKPKISDFGLARVDPANINPSYVITNPCGTPGYIDPDYYNGYLTQKADVYSFGIVLWEVLCGRLAHRQHKDDGVAFSKLVQRHYKRGTLYSIIPPDLHKQISTPSLLTFSYIAYQCLKNVEERPKMEQVVKQLEEALQNQREGNISKNEEKLAVGDEFVFSVFMHCQGCAKEVRKCLKDFEGVKHVETNCENHKVVVKGKKVDPLGVQKRIRNKTKRQVELLSPVSKPLPATDKKLEQEKSTNREDKKDEKPTELKKEEREAKPVAGEEPNDFPPPPPRGKSLFLKHTYIVKDVLEKSGKTLKALRVLNMLRRIVRNNRSQ